MTQEYWRRCSVCKKEIGFEIEYQVCSVSTCKKSVYCSQNCFGVHVPFMNHKDAWPEDGKSPTREQFVTSQSTSSGAGVNTGADAGARRKVISADKPFTPPVESEDVPEDILIVASKLKNYIKAKSGYNTSQNVMPKLSEIVRGICDEAIKEAANEGRKTVMDRDF